MQETSQQEISGATDWSFVKRNTLFEFLFFFYVLRYSFHKIKIPTKRYKAESFPFYISSIERVYVARNA